MTIYIDLLFLFNWWIDFFLLLIVKLTLKRVVNLKRILFGSLLGAFSTFLLFININFIIFIMIKIILGILMCCITFSFKKFSYTINNFVYLLMAGVILGGALNMIKPYMKHNNLLYFLSVIVLTPVILFCFIKQNRKIKKNYSLYYQVKVIFKNIMEINLCGFLDTGNKLVDPITKKPIILVEKKLLKGLYKIRSPMFVPVKTVNKSSLIECFKPDFILINNKIYKNYLVGACNNNLFNDGINCLLNNKLMEEI